LKLASTTAAALLLGLCACDRAADPPAAPKAPAQGATPAPSPTPSPAALFFVGRWAADPKLCDTGPWIITAQGLRTAGEVSCRFDGAPQGRGPVEVDATCTSEGAQKPWRLRFSYAEAAQALLVENGPFAATGLMRCRGPAYPEVEPRPPGSPGALPDDRTPVSEAPFSPTSAQGGADVVQAYFALIEAGRYDEAWKLRRGGESAQDFARRFSAYDSYHGLVGAPGRIEGAAGSLYLETPVQIYGRWKDGRELHQSGVAVLRRANDVPGATAEQRSWRIQEMKLQDAPAP
jgi:hypothetical protein